MRIVIAATALLVSACATSTPDVEEAKVDPLEDARIGEEVKSLCFASSINGFAEWEDGDGVIVRKGVRDRFLVTVFGTCTPIDHVQSIGTVNGGCLDRGDKLFVSNSFTGHGSGPFDNQFCRIKAIYEWNADALDGATDSEDEDAEAGADAIADQASLGTSPDA